MYHFPLLSLATIPQPCLQPMMRPFDNPTAESTHPSLGATLTRFINYRLQRSEARLLTYCSHKPTRGSRYRFANGVTWMYPTVLPSASGWHWMVRVSMSDTSLEATVIAWLHPALLISLVTSTKLVVACTKLTGHILKRSKQRRERRRTTCSICKWCVYVYVCMYDGVVCIGLQGRLFVEEVTCFASPRPEDCIPRWQARRWVVMYGGRIRFLFIISIQSRHDCKHCH